ncbi:MAG: PIG-L family deacetylase [Anaerolineaceae bacterium]
MKLIYLSPHLDDVVYSCGGRVWQQLQQGHQVEIWTLFAGDPPGDLTPFAQQLHTRWGTGTGAVAQRRVEDQDACQILGARYCHFNYPDCIYRRIPATGEPVIMVNDDLFKPIKEGEMELARGIAKVLRESNPEQSLMVAPLSVGGHVDHRLVRLAAELTGIMLGYYPDFPYSRSGKIEFASLLPEGHQQIHFELDSDAIKHWTRAVAAYDSQLTSFWESEVQMTKEVEAYSRTPAGSSCWLPIAYSQTQ